ncbi:MAG TPA: LysE family transporter [Candidatus Caccoplasma merdavium]|nr:LysE family transporter [Candidatus Caccoplasma merdavium]
MSTIELLIYIIIRGLAIGILVSAPMGPIGVLCIQRTLNKGRRSGLATGLGASLSDLCYAILTGLGLSIVVDFIEAHQAPLQIIGSLVLTGFGLYLFRQNPARNIRKKLNQKSSFTQDFASSFLLTLSNPLILLLLIGLFARLNFFLPEMKAGHYILGYVSIILGAFIWWFTITYIINKVRSHFNLRSLWLINRIISIVIIVMSLVGVGTGFYEYFIK